MQEILEILGRIGFDWRMGAFNLLNFFIIMWILKRYAFGPVMKVINERQEKITQGVEQAQKAKTDLQMAERKAQELIDEAKAKANGIVEHAAVDAQKVAQGLQDKAKTEIEVLVSQAKKSIETDRLEMMDQVRRESGQLMVLALEKILSEKIDEKKDASLIEKMLKKVKV